MMDGQDYFAPARFQPPPRRSPWILLRWLLLGLALVGLAFGIWYGIQHLLVGSMRAQMSSILPAAGVKVGEPLEWRELARRPLATITGTGTMGGLFADDFDGDGDQELLVIGPRGQSLLYEADGTSKAVGVSGIDFMMGGVSWDYDRDGTAEIVVPTILGDIQRGVRQGRSAEEMFISQDLPVYDLSGGEVARLEAVAATSGSVLVADMDGDGWPELLATKPDPQQRYGSATLVAFGAKGKKVWQLSNAMTTFAVCGDVDGDGLAEMITPAERMKVLAADGRDQERVTLHRWPGTVEPAVHPLHCADLDGDGRDEVLFCSSISDPTLGYLDCSANCVVDMAFPAGPEQAWVAVSTQTAVGGFLRGTQAMIAAATPSCGALLLFDPSGTCQYYEEFGEMIWGISALRSGGQDYLVVQLTERVLVYP
jgi:hypothetical protein